MQNPENIYEINLTQGTDSQEFVNNVASALELMEGKNSSIKLKSGDIQINQSQMVFVKTLVESYGAKLTFVETTNDTTRKVCADLGINSTNKGFDNVSVKINQGALEIQNSKLDDLRKEFKAELENSSRKEPENNANSVEETPKNQPALENDPPARKKLIEFSAEDTGEDKPDITPKKQSIGVYRKADEDENRLEFNDEKIDFYAQPTDEPVVVDTKDTICVNQTLRSGQILDYDGNIVIIGDCHPGSEIKATGDITVWGVLGSIAHAGIKGNREAKIRALKMNAVQLRIADCYSRRPDGGNIPYIIKSSVFTPEEARIVDDNVVLFKLAQD